MRPDRVKTRDRTFWASVRNRDLAARLFHVPTDLESLGAVSGVQSHILDLSQSQSNLVCIPIPQSDQTFQNQKNGLTRGPLGDLIKEYFYFTKEKHSRTGLLVMSKVYTCTLQTTLENGTCRMPLLKKIGHAPIVKNTIGIYKFVR